MKLKDKMESHKRYKEISDWYRQLSTNQKTAEIKRFVATNLFVITEEEQFSRIASVSRELAIECLTDYKDPDFELIVSWYGTVCWLIEYYLDENNYDSGSKVLAPLIRVLYAAKELFSNAKGVKDAESLHNTMMASLAIYSVKLEEINPAKFDDADIESLKNMVNSFKEKLSDQYLKTLEPTGDKVSDSAAEAKEAFGDM